MSRAKKLDRAREDLARLRRGSLRLLEQGTQFLARPVVRLDTWFVRRENRFGSHVQSFGEAERVGSEIRCAAFRAAL
ncbi:hypothetical protein [Frankia sp. AgB32]|uniref:hypothetical protein n=1 Tax=Frankia sp. AgB32 TaxID=631119 RepID=UPI00200DD6E6|nr:hypothetical protein [Frankia sp. AgB32]MCK9893041.1 hypothetical protein [Frankia sp. AgB32]